MIFHKLSKLIQKLIELTICKFLRLEVRVSHRVMLTVCKPVFGCLICMSSVWTIIFWLIDPNFLLVPMILIVAGINTVLVAIIKDIMPYECNEDN